MICDGAAAADTTSVPSWAPVLVTALLADPVVSLEANACHLDGPLAWAAYLDHAAERGPGSLPPLTDGFAADFALPLATWTAAAPDGADPSALNGGGMAWGWACSRARFAADGHPVVNVRKRPETDAATRMTRDRRWDLSSGPLKARDVPRAAVMTREVTWHALGDPDAIRHLLARVPALGALTRHGNGRVLEWLVGDHPDRDAWRDRVMPLPGGRPHGVRAPYWHRSRRMPCTP